MSGWGIVLGEMVVPAALLLGFCGFRVAIWWFISGLAVVSSWECLTEVAILFYFWQKNTIQSIYRVICVHSPEVEMACGWVLRKWTICRLFVEFVATLLVSVIAWMAVSFVVSAYVEASCVSLSSYYVGELCHGCFVVCFYWFRVAVLCFGSGSA